MKNSVIPVLYFESYMQNIYKFMPFGYGNIAFWLCI